MPIDPEVQAALDALKASVTAEALGKAIGAALTAHLPGHLKAINDEITALKAAKTADPDPKNDDGKGKGKDGKGDDATNQRVAALEKSLAESKAREDAAASKAKADSLSASARDALIKHGVPADRVAHAMAFVNAQGVLTYEGDKPGWKGKDQYGADAVLDIDAAAKAFLSTADGKLYLPPVGAQGTGGGVGGSGGQNGQPAKLGELSNQQRGGMLTNLLNAVG